MPPALHLVKRSTTEVVASADLSVGEPEPWAVERVEILWPEEIRLEALGESEPIRWTIVAWGSDGEPYAPVQLAGGTLLWVAVRIEGEGEDTELWVEPGAQTYGHLEVGIRITTEDGDVLEGGAVVLVYPLPELPTDTSERLGVMVERADADPGEIAAPGQPQFERSGDADAIVTWHPVEGATGYIVWWARGELRTGAPPALVEDFDPGDWLCARAVVGSVEADAYRCNTWREE